MRQLCGRSPRTCQSTPDPAHSEPEKESSMKARRIGTLTSAALLFVATASAASPPAKPVDFDVVSPGYGATFDPLMPSANASYGAWVTNNGVAAIENVMVRFV